jgi:putative transcriptional regulator
MKLKAKSVKSSTPRGYLDGQMLIAMPMMGDERFTRSLIYVCAHSNEGAMGIVVNQIAGNINFPDLLVQLDVIPAADRIVLPVRAEAVKVLKAIARGNGPNSAILALGYAGWAPGQLETEIQQNGWLHCAADKDLIFGTDVEKKYSRALQKIGIDLAMLSSEAGHA